MLFNHNNSLIQKERREKPSCKDLIFTLLFLVTNAINSSFADAFSTYFQLTATPALSTTRMTDTTVHNDVAEDSFDLLEFSTEEKLSWLGGYDLWNLRAIPGITPSNDCTSSSGRIGNKSTPLLSFRSTTSTLKPSTSLCLSDGPHGLRKPLNDLTLQEAHPATCFPSACSTACSWNPKLLEIMGRALAKECNYYGVQVLLGPGVNIKRHPCGGRNHEYFSEDPYLAGILAKSYIGGVQESGSVGACIKHFCLNNQESKRFVVDVVVDERTMREIYLPAFEHALCDSDKKCVPKLVMGAYNKVNGVYCCQNKYLLGQILRDEWKYDGVVVSDWGAVLDRKASLKAGMDLEMPGTPSGGAFDNEVLEECQSERNTISQSIENDEEQPIVTSSSRNNSNSELETAIDDCANRVVQLITDLQPPSDDPELVSTNADSKKLFAENNRLAREIASECIVLLQNNDNYLPLSRDAIFSNSMDNKPKIGIIGAFAKDSPRYQGMGSAHVTPASITTFYEAMCTEASTFSAENNRELPFAKGYDPDVDGDEIEQPLIDEAVELAKKVTDAIVVCIGLPEIAESEGFDRAHCRLPQQHIALVEALTNVHPNIVVVLSNGGIVEIPQFFVDKAQAIVDGFLLGQAGGAALADILLGDISPSGKLPETMPISPDVVVPSAKYFPGAQQRVEYREGLDVGYRYYDTVGIPVRFPFGHGLHYTTFEYNNLDVIIERDEADSKRVKVLLDVTNKPIDSFFSKPAKDVVQLYIKPINSSVYRPHHELKAFSKIEIAPGCSEKVEFVLDERAFAFYDVGRRDWVVEDNSGGFEICVGASSRDIRLTRALNFATGSKVSELAKTSYPPLSESSLPSSASSTSLTIDDTTFSKRFGSTAQYSDDVSPKITRNTLMLDAAKKSRIAAALLFMSWMVAKREVKEGPTMKRELRMIRANIENVPLRSLVVFSQGNLTFRTMDVLIHVMNGEFRKAFGRLFGRQSQSTSL